MAGFGNASTFVKAGLLLVCLAILLDLIGFATSYWTSYYGGHHGLWKSCIKNRYGGETCYTHSSSGWFEATQAFETIGFIAGVASLVLIILYVFVPATSGKRIISILSMLACFAAAGCIILGIIIYGSKSHNLSWSFALCTIGGVLFAVCGILLVVDMLKR